MVLLHFFLVPQAFWPFGAGARAQTKPAPSTGTLIFGFIGLVASFVGASIGARHFVNGTTSSVVGVLEPLAWLVSKYESLLKAIGFPQEPAYDARAGLSETTEFIKSVNGLFLSGIHDKFVQQMPKPAGFSGEWTADSAEFALAKHTALVAALAIFASWAVIVLDKISADKGVLNPVRKFVDGALSVLTAACSLAGAVVLTAIYTFDALFLFSAGHLVLFNYPVLFRIAGVAMAAGAVGYVYWIGTFSKSFWEMHTFGLTLACAMTFNVLAFYVVCDSQGSSISGSCYNVRNAAGWGDNWNPLNWEPSWVLFLVYLRTFMHATAALGNSLCDRIDGGPDVYFKQGVANVYQVKTAMYDSFDVIFRLVPLALLYQGVAAGTSSDSPAVKMVNLIDEYFRTNIVLGLLAIIGTVFAWVAAAVVFFLTTVTTLRELVLTNPELTMFVAIMYVSTKVAFGSDNEDRYNPLGDMTKYFNSAVATVQDVVPVLSAKKDKAAASPKAGGAPRAGSAKRK